MQGLYYSLTHNFGCVAKTKALTKSLSGWLPPETGCTQQHRPWNRPTNSSSHVHTYSLDGPVLFLILKATLLISSRFIGCNLSRREQPCATHPLQ